MTGKPVYYWRSAVTLFSWCAVVFVWGGLIAACFVPLEKYANKAGEASASPAEWPTEIIFNRDQGKATLVCVLHPHCPCSRATLEELSQLMSACKGQVTAYVLFWTPAECEASWAAGSLWNMAQRIDGLTVKTDPGGKEADRLGAATSGQTLLFDRDGRLLFTGGITSKRGQTGPSTGYAAILAGVHSGNLPVRQTPVYGCSLRG
jgi:hypothetical protein